MEDGRTTAANVAQAVATALDCSSTPDSRRGAVAYLESVKGGDIHILANTSLFLIQKDSSSEIRLHGFKMLQHLVRFRWDAFNIKEQSDFAKVAVNLIMEMANPREEWALKSQTAALVAELIRREGVVLWQELLPSFISLSNRGPVEAELVAMILRWLPEDITVHNEDLEGDRRRVLLRGLTESLSEILPLLYALLEKHFGAALSEYNRQQFAVAKQHVAVLTATLNAANAYAEWVPLPDLAKYRLIDGCGFLLSSIEFRLHACEFFKLLSQRKRPHDATASEFDFVMANIFQILMHISGDFLSKYGTNIVISDENELEFAERTCESMTALGSLHMQCIALDGWKSSQFLNLMLGYFQHCKFALHFQSLHFWLALMRDLVSKGKSAVQAAGTDVDNLGLGSVSADKQKKGVPVLISDETCVVILDVSLQRLIKKGNIPGWSSTFGPLELWSDDFDGSDFSQYRFRMLELIRLVAAQKPLVASARISQRLDAIVKSFVQSSITAEVVALLESMQPGLEAIVGAIFDVSMELNNYTSEVKFQLHGILEGLLQQLLSLKWTEPTLAELLAHYLDAMGPYLKYFPDSVTPVVNKLFELLTSLPLTIKDPSSNIARHARLQICTSFIRIAKAADKSLLPLMKSIADTMAILQAGGRLLRGEHNLLGEAFLIMACSSGIQQQQEVLAWLLEPLSKHWIQLEWQNTYLSDALGLSKLFLDPQLMWSIFHTVTFFEKALKRSGYKKANWTSHNCSSVSDSSCCSHPMTFHLSWMLPPLLRLLQAVHSLWSPGIAQVLTGELRGAKNMSPGEQASLLGETNLKLPKVGQLSDADGSQLDAHREGELNEADIRNWLKGIRDSGYNVLGLSANIGDSFFSGLDNSLLTVALMENIQSMDFRHIRQLIHLVLVPLVKSCPANLWGKWLENLLHPLFLHCQHALSGSWSSLIHEGRAKVPDTFSDLSQMELKLEVMEEKLLRDLTREICSLLSVLASPSLNTTLPSLDHLGNVNREDSSLLIQLDALSSNSMIGFLMTHKSLALPALRITIEALTWTDGEAVAKVTSFCGAIILFTISTDIVELREFVTRDLFYAIIQGLFLESNAFISSGLVALCREIYVYLSNREPTPRQILLSLPCITRDDLVAFEDALNKTSSPKEQKQHMRSLLQLATGNKLRALSVQKSTNVITNVTELRSVVRRALL
ncbi:Protein HASTY 1 [Apostasia shenzhenica]|uniref:Protein HASTY 1 n=1 Tax=Apostasia shenzhenica TaxID=1088818 RepID=A0A2I0AXX6_9ASPA|nr:Protein HASTY 1 [Apostasia shenzhenica]